MKISATGGTCECDSVKDLLATLTGPKPQINREMAACFLTEKKDVQLSDTDAVALSVAIQNCQWMNEISFMGTRFGTQWPTVIMGFAKSRLKYVTLNNCGLDDAAGRELVSAIPHLPTLVTLKIAGANRIGSEVLEEIVKAISRLPTSRHLEKALLAMANDEHDISDAALSAAAELRRLSPNCLFGEGPSGRVLQARLSTLCLRNDAVDRAMTDTRQQLLGLYIGEGEIEVAAQREFDRMKALAEMEQKRLLELIPEIVDKANLLDGMQLMQSVRSVNQDVLQPLNSRVPTDSHVAVRAILGRAALEQQAFEDLLHCTVDACQKLANATLTDIDRLFGEWQMPDIAVQLHTLTVQAPHFERDTIQSCAGYYEQDGFFNGFPSYCKKRDAKGSKFFFMGFTGGWKLANALGSKAASAKLKDSEKMQLAEALDQKPWCLPNGSILNDQLVMERGTVQKDFKTALVKFLTNWRENKVVRSLCSLERGKLVELKIGPPKNFSRAVEKADHCKDWGGATALIDMNRATFLVDSPVVMFFVYHYVKTRVEQSGGSIKRVSNNFFNKRGEFEDRYKSPPCLHLSVQTSTQWVYEVLVMFPDLYRAKSRIHMFYQVARATAPDQVLCCQSGDQA